MLGFRDRWRQAIFLGIYRLMRAFEGWFEWEVRGMERDAEEDPGPSRPIVFYGSSSIRLWTSLARDLGEPRIINLGFGGSTLADCVKYFERLVVTRKPASLVVYAGDNDFGLGASALGLFESFQQLLTKVDTHFGPIPFAFLSIKPSPARWEMIDEIRSANEMIRKALSERPNSVYIDIDAPMLGADGQPRTELFAEDGLHLSPAGYRVWAAEILKHRDSIFA